MSILKKWNNYALLCLFVSTASMAGQRELITDSKPSQRVFEGQVHFNGSYSKPIGTRPVDPENPPTENDKPYGRKWAISKDLLGKFIGAGLDLNNHCLQVVRLSDANITTAPYGIQILNTSCPKGNFLAPEESVKATMYISGLPIVDFQYQNPSGPFVIYAEPTLKTPIGNFNLGTEGLTLGTTLHILNICTNEYEQACKLHIKSNLISSLVPEVLTSTELKNYYVFETDEASWAIGKPVGHKTFLRYSCKNVVKKEEWARANLGDLSQLAGTAKVKEILKKFEDNWIYGLIERAGGNFSDSAFIAKQRRIFAERNAYAWSDGPDEQIWYTHLLTGVENNTAQVQAETLFFPVCRKSK